MRRIRRSDSAVRLEMMPLLDVVFLLLTFFIYSMVVMVRADALSIGLSPVAGGQRASEAPEHVLSVEQDGSFTYNREAIDDSALTALLTRLSADPGRPAVYVTLKAGNDQPTPDRGPVVWSLLQRVEQAGIDRVVMVGAPAGAEAR